ncbi:unnamed protein product, partial [Musa acuminata subsp. burmannicoides]
YVTTPSRSFAVSELEDAVDGSSPAGKSESKAKSRRMLADRIRRKLTDLVGKEEKTLDDLMRITHTSAWTNRNAANLPKTTPLSSAEEAASSKASSIVAAVSTDA